MELESPENFNFKSYTVPEILVFKVRQILQFSQKGVRKVRKWYFQAVIYHSSLQIASPIFLVS